MMLMASAVALAKTTAATASATPSGPAAAPLAAASGLYTFGQGMGATGTSVPRPGVLDPCQGFPSSSNLISAIIKNIFFSIGGKAVQNLTVNFLSRRGYTVLL